MKNLRFFYFLLPISKYKKDNINNMIKVNKRRGFKTYKLQLITQLSKILYKTIKKIYNYEHTIAHDFVNV